MLHFLFSLVLVASPDPETIIELSVGKYTKQKKTTEEKLPKGFGDEVAKRIEEKRNTLLDCLGPDVFKETFNTELLITKEGQANLEFNPKSERKELTCVKKVLESVQYPTHKLPKAVMVRLPLELEREKK